MDVDDLYVVDRIGNHRSICLSALAKQTVEDAEATHLGGDTGLFIYEVDDNAAPGAGVHVLAKAISFEAAMRLVEVWRMSRFSAPIRDAAIDSI